MGETEVMKATVEIRVARKGHEDGSVKVAVTNTLDVRGLITPEPCLQVAAALEHMGPGEVIEVLNNDPFSVSDIIRWCSYEGVEYLELRYLPHGVDRFLLRKPRTPGR